MVLEEKEELKVFQVALQRLTAESRSFVTGFVARGFAALVALVPLVAQAEPPEGTLQGVELYSIRKCTDPAPSMPEQSELALRATTIIRSDKGMGSGVIISPDGFLLTAAHVVTQSQVEVRLYNDEIVSAELLLLNREKDVALLRVKDYDKPLPCLILSEERAQIGEDIYVLGSPAGEELSFSVSRGIVSGLRTFKGTEFLQTDAAINPGNSGGPLVGREGSVRAIASWKVASKEMEGLGFAVPSVTALAALGIEWGDASDEIPPLEIAQKEEKAPVPHKAQEIDYPEENSYQPTRRAAWVRPVRSTGYLVATLGVGTILGSWIAHLATNDAQKFDTHKTYNIIGWAATGVGATMIASSYIWGAPKKVPAKSAKGEPVASEISLGIGFGMLSLQGAY